MLLMLRSNDTGTANTQLGVGHCNHSMQEALKVGGRGTPLRLQRL